MRRRGVRVVSWLAGGHAVAIGLFVALVNVPDANVAMLGLSVALTLTIVAVTVMTDATALAWLLPDSSFRRGLGLAARRGAPAVCLAALAMAACRAAGSTFDAWRGAHAGEMDAWIMATFGTARTTWIHRGLDVVAFLVWPVIGLSLGLALSSAVIVGGWPGLLRGTWVKAAFTRQQLGLVGLVAVAALAWPWGLAAWRPAGLPPDWVEVAFVAVKLGLVYLVANAGWALLLFVGGRVASRDAGSR